MGGPTGGQDELSRALLRLRKASGLTGVEAGKRAGWSQAKVSRYETGRRVPRPEDVTTLARIYRAGPREQRRLERLAAVLWEDTRPPARVTMLRPERMQHRIGEIEASSAVIRSFAPTLVPGLLQTPAYIRATFDTFGGFTEEAIERGVAGRLERQALLADPSRRFVLLMSEGALLWQVGGPSVMVEQLEHLRVEVRRAEHVRIGVIPWQVRAPAIPMHAFDVYDERAVVVGTRTATAFLTDRHDVEPHRSMFAALESSAGFDAACLAVLTRVLNQYHGL